CARRWYGYGLDSW
nr:immunoglobulin heavy chain junction region [Macaca mulatta]MOV48265.1 immunoglobulin heavy chain junction region [Macaca mulatta]